MAFAHGRFSLLWSWIPRCLCRSQLFSVKLDITWRRSIVALCRSWSWMPRQPGSPKDTRTHVAMCGKVSLTASHMSAWDLLVEKRRSRHLLQLLHTQDTSTIWIVFRVCRVCLQLISHFTYFAFHFCIAFQCSSLPCAAESFQILVRWTNPHTSGNGTGSSRALERHDIANCSCSQRVPKVQSKSWCSMCIPAVEVRADCADRQKCRKKKLEQLQAMHLDHFTVTLLTSS